MTFPLKADSELVIDTNAVLTFPIATQFLQAVSRRIPQVFQFDCEINCLQFSGRDPGYIAEFPALSGKPELPCFLVGERSDHGLLYHV